MESLILFKNIWMKNKNGDFNFKICFAISEEVISENKIIWVNSL